MFSLEEDDLEPPQADRHHVAVIAPVEEVLAWALLHVPLKKGSFSSVVAFGDFDTMMVRPANHPCL